MSQFTGDITSIYMHQKQPSCEKLQKARVQKVLNQKWQPRNGCNDANVDHFLMKNN